MSGGGVVALEVLEEVVSKVWRGSFVLVARYHLGGCAIECPRP